MLTSPLNFLTLRDRGSSLVPYAKAWAFQKELVEKRVRDEIPDTFLFTEHPATITRGRGLQWTPDREARAMPLGPLPAGVDYFEVERGGDLTWHGPGQLVIYPIVKLDGTGFGPERDVTGYLRKLEASLGRGLARYGLTTVARENATGVWVVPQSSPTDLPRKIASLGIAVRKWVTYHGIGLNISNDAAGFQAISPCGYSPEVMTRLADITKDGVDLAHPESRARLELQLASEFGGGYVTTRDLEDGPEQAF